MNRDISLFLEDILDKINLIEDSILGLSKSDFESNKLLPDATLRRLEIIGEAVKNLPDSLRKKYPKVPWGKIAGLRDVIVHAYFGVENEIIWDIIKKNLPVLKKQIQKIKEEL